jgi:hypothetical protein
MAQAYQACDLCEQHYSVLHHNKFASIKRVALEEEIKNFADNRK